MAEWCKVITPDGVIDNEPVDDPKHLKSVER